MFLKTMMRWCAGVVAVGGASMLGAQSAPTPTVFGVHGGLSYSTLSGTSDENVSYRASYVIGGYMDLKLSAPWSFQPEAQYIVKGAKISGTSEGTAVNAEIQLKYVEVPILLRWNGTPSSGGVTPFAQLGPQVSFKTGCDASGSSSGVNVSFSCETAGINVESTDFGVIGGLGADMNVSGHVFTGTVRYDLGLKNISSEGSDVKNRAFTFLVGLRF